MQLLADLQGERALTLNIEVLPVFSLGQAALWLVADLNLQFSRGWVQGQGDRGREGQEGHEDQSPTEPRHPK